ncbi:MAG: PAS domain S-box protein [Mucilaginibacter sp.]|nr:PAS domain S-box protein [Mucilaginibacter sp.]
MLNTDGNNAGGKKDVLEKLRQKAEDLLLSKNILAGKSDVIQAHQLFHELQIHQLELEMQNDELNIVAEELEIQKNKFFSLFELAPVGYLILNNKTIISDINSTGSRLLGVRKPLLYSKPLPSFVHADDINIFYSFFRRMLSLDTEQNCQLRLFRSGQSAFYAQLNGICIGENARQSCYVTISDITEKKEAELQLKNVQRRLEVALNASLTGIWEIDIQSGQVYLDNFCHLLFGLVSDDFDGKYASFLAFVDEAERENVDSTLRVAIVRETDFNIEFSIHTRDKVHKYVNARGKIVYGDEDRRFTGTITDITERKKMELETRQLKEDQQQQITEAALQAEENARRNISESLHDSIGQTLYAIRLNLQHLHGSEAEAYLKQAEQLLDQCIRDVRNLSFELAPAILKDFGLTATLQEMANRLSNKDLAINVQTNGIARLEMNLMINIYRIVQELVNNSVKHSGGNLVNISLFKKGHTIHIEVTDNGKGFTPEKKKQKPNGSGLSSIRNRLTLYQGMMEIESGAEKGTRVVIKMKQSE